MGQTIGYIRVTSDKQTVDNQRLAILDYCIARLSSVSVTILQWCFVSIEEDVFVDPHRFSES